MLTLGSSAAGCEDQVSKDNNNDKNTTCDNADPATIVVVHDFVYPFANKGQAKERGENRDHHDKSCVGGVDHN